jgi:hypothetical protein
MMAAHAAGVAPDVFIEWSTSDPKYSDDGLKLERVSGQWDDAEEYLLDNPPAPREPKKTEPLTALKAAEKVETLTALKAKDEGWGKRRSLGSQLFISPRLQPEISEESTTQPVPEAAETKEEGRPSASEGSTEESYTEDDVNPANDIRRRIWRIKDALNWIAPDDEMMRKVGAVLWRVSEDNREAGCTVWVKWLEAHGVDDATARAQWAKGFEGRCKADKRRKR